MTSGINDWRGTPPAVFPPLLGLYGVGFAWMRAQDVVASPGWIGAAFLIVATGLFVLALVQYARKLIARPDVVMDDLAVIPARAAVPAMTVCLMLAATSLMYLSKGLAALLLFLALALHVLVAAIVVYSLFRPGQKGRRLSPVLHLPFVGLIVGMQAAITLGYDTIGAVVVWISGAAAIVLWIGGIRLLLAGNIPLPLRPPQVIHIAPLALMGLVASLLDDRILYQFCLYASLPVLVLLISKTRWLTEGGMSPTWAAFIFPLAATANLHLLAYSGGAGWVFLVTGIGLLALTTVLSPMVTAFVFKRWRVGVLGEKTGAARA